MKIPHPQIALLVCKAVGGKEVCLQYNPKGKSKKEDCWGEAKDTRLCPILCDPMDCSPPGSSVHGILQTRILEWAAIPFSRGSSQPRDRTQVSTFTVWATREA